MPDLASEAAIELIDEEADLPQGERPPINRQLYCNNPVKDSPAAKVYSIMPDILKLENRKEPNLGIQHEKPEHRLILLLKLKGYSNREVAKQTGYTEPHISQTCRQPWFQLRLAEALKEAKEEIVEGIVKVEAINSIHTLVLLRDTAESESVRATCAMNILDRHLGKPMQKSEVTGNVLHAHGHVHTLARAEDIDQQLAEIIEQERQLSQSTTSA